MSVLPALTVILDNLPVLVTLLASTQSCQAATTAPGSSTNSSTLLPADCNKTEKKT